LGLASASLGLVGYKVHDHFSHARVARMTTLFSRNNPVIKDSEVQKGSFSDLSEADGFLASPIENTFYLDLFAIILVSLMVMFWLYTSHIWAHVIYYILDKWIIPKLNPNSNSLINR
jgi:hypothetical protein